MNELNKDELKKEIENTFCEMQELTHKVSSMLDEVKGYVVDEEILAYTENLIKQWSQIADKHAAATNELYNLQSIKKLSKYN